MSGRSLHPVTKSLSHESVQDWMKANSVLIKQ